ncbi:hypothetical protein DPMN_137834 [Dreissena polymorpha]|uniref:Uncharacterized protein n=1 Tax=Dreissena polymorpha TaxID=45954 RepID=A0A9D4JI09_DREPO|nr:hypothetical protein DPMN_137834 [Dreissena polymorpha]
MVWQSAKSTKGNIFIIFAKLVLQRSKFDSTNQAVYKLHWLPIKARIIFKLLTFMYKCSNNESPTYITELLTKHIPNRQGLLSYGSNMASRSVQSEKDFQ